MWKPHALGARPVKWRHEVTAGQMQCVRDFCTAEVIVGDSSTMNVLSCVDTWRERSLPLFLLCGGFWVILPSQLPLEFLVSSLA